MGRSGVMTLSESFEIHYIVKRLTAREDFPVKASNGADRRVLDFCSNIKDPTLTRELYGGSILLVIMLGASKYTCFA
jgi:hypothetical protein